MNRKIVKKEIKSWLVTILIVFAVKATFVEAYVIPTPSMENRLLLSSPFIPVAPQAYGAVPCVINPYTPKECKGSISSLSTVTVTSHPFPERSRFKGSAKAVNAAFSV